MSSYQGYPYTKPPVTEVATLTRDEELAMERWRNLPVKQVTGDRGNAGPSTSSSSPTPKPDLSRHVDVADTPVLYIDIPESGGIVEKRVAEEPDYIQDTIYYNPFEDENQTNDPPSTSFNQYGASRTDPQPAYIPPSKEASIYKPQELSIYQPQDLTPDGFTLTPLPVNDRQPPSYDEVERMDTGRIRDQPRTQVITMNPSPIISQFERKYVNCQFCRNNVHTQVLKENGFYTYVVLGIFLIGFFPLIVLFFCTDVYKYKNHYCPSCNMKIGYEIPCLCVEMTFVNASQQT